MHRPTSLLLLLLLSLGAVQALSKVRDHQKPPREEPLPPAKRELSAGISAQHVARNNAHHHGRMIRKRSGKVNVERGLIGSILDPGAGNAAPTPTSPSGSPPASTPSPSASTPTSTASSSSSPGLLDNITSDLLGGTGSQSQTSSTSSSTSSTTQSSTSSTASTTSSATSTTSSSTTTSSSATTSSPTSIVVVPTGNNQASTEFQYVTTAGSRPSISASPTSSADAAGSATSSTSIAKTTLIAIIVIASVVGVSAAVFTIVRKWKFGPSSKFEDRMQPIDFSPGGGVEEVEEKAHRRGTSGGSWEAGSAEKEHVPEHATYPDAAGADAYAAYPQAHDYTSNAAYPPAHDFTAGPVGEYGYTGHEQYGYADLQRGADPNAQYYADPHQQGADLARGPSANYGQYAAHYADAAQQQGADLARGPSANYGQHAAYVDPTQQHQQGADLARGPSANYGQYAQHAYDGYAQQHTGYGNNGGYPAPAHGQQQYQGGGGY